MAQGRPGAALRRRRRPPALTRNIHIVGAGLAGLAAAIRLSERHDSRVTVWESTGKAGGRCRSYYDAQLDRRIDNGNHLMLSGNRAVLDYARRIGGDARLEIGAPDFPFLDLATGARWTVRLPRTPLGLLSRHARPPGVALRDLAGVASLLTAPRGATVAQAIRGRGEMWRAFWEPLTIAVLNAAPEHADAGLLRTSLRRTFLKGARAARPVLAPEGLGPALVDPALALLERRNVPVHLRAPLGEVSIKDDRVASLTLGGETITLGPDDAVILALPPSALGRALPGLPVPGDGAAIVNVHFRVAPDPAARLPAITGLLSGRLHWLFRRGDVVSATVSAVADDPFWTRPRDEVLAEVWPEIAAALDAPDAEPLAARLLKEKAATFDPAPDSAARRPATQGPAANLFLAGDVVQTGLPATIESAVASGDMAAAAALRGR